MSAKAGQNGNNRSTFKPEKRKDPFLTITESFDSLWNDMFKHFKALDRAWESEFEGIIKRAAKLLGEAEAGNGDIEVIIRRKGGT